MFDIYKEGTIMTIPIPLTDIRPHSQLYYVEVTPGEELGSGTSLATYKLRGLLLPFIALHAARVQLDEVGKLVWPAASAVLAAEVATLVLAAIVAVMRPGSSPLLHATYIPFAPVKVGH
jgi:hypothetical protein